MGKGSAEIDDVGRLRFDRFLLDKADERLLGPDGPIKIGNKAFQVLQALIDREGRLLTKDELFETVWDGTHVTESALTSVIKELRRALGDKSRAARIIESVYGRGYRLLVEVERLGAEAYPDDRPSGGDDFPSLDGAPDKGGGETAAEGRRQRSAPGGKAKAEKTAAKAPLGRRTTLAILPFVNRSSVTRDDEFAEALTEDLTAALSGSWGYRVLSPRIMSGYRGERIDVREIARDLGVDYLIEGSLRRRGQSVRVSAQLIDAHDGSILLTHTFDRPQTEFAELLDDLVANFQGRMGVEIERVELSRAARKDHSETAWDALKRSTVLLTHSGVEHIEQAARHARRAVELAPDYPVAVSNLGVVLGLLYQRDGSRKPELLDEAQRHIMRALQMDRQHHMVLSHASYVKYYAQQWEESLLLAESAYQCSPDSFQAIQCLAGALTREERYDEALALLERADAIAPGGTATIFTLINRCWSYYGMGRIDDAIDAATRMLKVEAFDHTGLMMRGVLYAERGDWDLARRDMLELRRYYPDEPLDLMLNTIRTSRLADRVRNRNAELFEMLWRKVEDGGEGPS